MFTSRTSFAPFGYKSITAWSRATLFAILPFTELPILAQLLDYHSPLGIRSGIVGFAFRHLPNDPAYLLYHVLIYHLRSLRFAISTCIDFWPCRIYHLLFLAPSLVLPFCQFYHIIAC